VQIPMTNPRRFMHLTCRDDTTHTYGLVMISRKCLLGSSKYTPRPPFQLLISPFCFFAGSACLFDEHDGTLFSGDAVYVDAALDWTDGEAMQASLRRLADLDVRIVHAGHERSFDAAELRGTVDAWVARLGA